MNCADARNVLAELDDPVVDVLPEAAKAHLRNCPECERVRSEMSRTWQILGKVEQVEPSEDFAVRVLARAASAFPSRPPPPRWPAWRWMAAAAGLLLVVLPALLTTNNETAPPPRPETAATFGTDAWDNDFLEELGQSLDRADRGYLSEYDTWPRDIVEGQTDERNQTERPTPVPKTREKGDERHEGA